MVDARLFLMHGSGKYYAEVKRKKTKNRLFDFISILWLPWRRIRKLVETYKIVLWESFWERN